MTHGFIFRADDGTEQDVTEDVGCLYDLVIGSMDWGSGFLTVEDAAPVVRIAKLGQFEGWERAQKYVDDQSHSYEQAVFLREHPDAIAVRWIRASEHVPAGLRRSDLQIHPAAFGPTVPTKVEHDHVFSSVGRCMWSTCPATAETGLAPSPDPGDEEHERQAAEERAQHETDPS